MESAMQVDMADISECQINRFCDTQAQTVPVKRCGSHLNTTGDIVTGKAC